MDFSRFTGSGFGRAAGEFFRSRQFRSGGYSVAYILVFVAILAAANWLGVQYNGTYDSTSLKLYSLSDQTHKILDNLDRDVTMSYFDRTPEFESASGMLRRYENASSRVRVEYIDPDEDPVKAEAMNVRSYGTLILHVGGQRREASSTSEQDITNAIITALKGGEKTACVATGHGEAASDDREREGFANAKQLIEDASYGYEDVSVAADGVPADCTLLVIPGPVTDFFEPEVEAIRNYVETGGRLLVMLRPALLDRRGESPKLVELLGSWGVDAPNDIVIDESPVGQLFGGGPFTPLVSDYKFHAIVEPMGNLATLFPRARTVSKADDVPDAWTLDELFETSPSSFATDSITVEGSAVKLGPPASRTEGPIPLAVAGTYDVPEPEQEGEASQESAGEDDEIASAEEESEPEGRVVAVGSAGFASNYGLSLGGNQDLLLNMMNWLSSDEDLISIRPKDPESTPIEMTSAEMRRIFLGSLLLLPLVIVVTGFWTWWGRR